MAVAKRHLRRRLKLRSRVTSMQRALPPRAGHQFLFQRPAWMAAATSAPRLLRRKP